MFRGLKQVVSEISSAWSTGIIPVWGPFSFTGLRSNFRVATSKYWGATPAYENTIINYDLARQIYRNDGTDSNLGALFGRPIVDLQVEFMGIPNASTENETIDDLLNDCLHIYWADEINQIFRDAIRDSKTVVRIRRPSLDDPLMTATDREHCVLELIVPERVLIERDPFNKSVIKSAVITHDIVMQDEPFDWEVGALPVEREHQVLEIITPIDIRFFDKTDMKELTDLSTLNDWGFVPLIEIYNEWDTSLQGGQSDLEPVYPFIRAFHDVLAQSLQAHKYHSIPKVKFQITDVAQFIKNNFPEALDTSTGQIKPQTTISWRGKETIFLQADEDAGFLEARSVLGDSKTLLEFLLDCVSIASETPKWAFMVVDQGASDQAQNARTVPFAKKIKRKRINYTRPIQDLLKMYLKILGIAPIRAKITWEAQQAQELVTETQALQQLIMGLEVAAQRGIISDTTYREMLRQFVPVMKSPEQEAEDAKSNVQLAVAPTNVPAGSNGKGNPDNVPIGAGPQGKNE